MIQTFFAVEVGLFCVPNWTMTRANLHFCMWCNKIRHKSAKAKSNIWYQNKWKNRTSLINKTKMERLILFKRLSMWQLETQLFALPCIFTCCTLSRRVKACWSRGWAKNQVSTNQNSGNSWYQIVRGTAC